uniref:hypothetical protein n=1 Tax=Thaumasiovibrio occultus TaxID=1891184 RepID=UPI00131C2458|nr:hypothetical protein [Thaumasiovibrio occultus]
MNSKVRDVSHLALPLHDGMHEDNACLSLTCCQCGAVLKTGLLAGIAQGKHWYHALPTTEQQGLVTAFGYQLSLLGNIPMVKLPSGRNAYFVLLDCACNERWLAVVEYYEYQPARYKATLVATARFENAAT